MIKKKTSLRQEIEKNIGIVTMTDLSPKKCTDVIMNEIEERIDDIWTSIDYVDPSEFYCELMRELFGKNGK